MPFNREPPLKTWKKIDIDEAEEVVELASREAKNKNLPEEHSIHLFDKLRNFLEGMATNIRLKNKYTTVTTPREYNAPWPKEILQEAEAKIAAFSSKDLRTRDLSPAQHNTLDQNMHGALLSLKDQAEKTKEKPSSNVLVRTVQEIIAEKRIKTQEMRRATQETHVDAEQAAAGQAITPANREVLFGHIASLALRFLQEENAIVRRDAIQGLQKEKDQPIKDMYEALNDLEARRNSSQSPAEVRREVEGILETATTSELPYFKA